MKVLTKELAEKFVKSQGYEIIRSTRLSDFSFEEGVDSNVYFPMSLSELVNHIEEIYIVWDSMGDIIGFWDDWEQVLDDILGWDTENEYVFKQFCKENDINPEEWLQ